MRPRKPIDLNRPEAKSESTIRCQLAIAPGPLQAKIRRMMEVYGMEQSAVCRMLMVAGMEALDGKRVA